MEESAARARAAAVRAVLVDLWGAELPPSGDPVVTVLVDAVGADDAHGAGRGLVVQGDGLTLAALADLVAGVGDAASRRASLPAALRGRLDPC